MANAIALRQGQEGLMGPGQFGGLGQGLVFEGADDPGRQTQGLGRQEQVLADGA